MSEVAAEPRRGQVIDLMAALKASLEKRGVAARAADGAEEETAARGAEARTEADARKPRPVVQRQRAGSKK